MASNHTQHHWRHKALVLAIAAIPGILVAIFVPLPQSTWLVKVLLGYIVTALAFVARMLWVMMRADAEATRGYVKDLDPGRSWFDIVVTVAALAALLGVGLMLMGQGTSSSAKVVQACMTVGTVASSWMLVHTLYAQRYARHYLNLQQGCIDFNTDADPVYSDFVYVAFAVGMSYAISDTDLTTKEIRRIQIGHAFLAYILGTVSVGATINLIAGLAG